VPIGGRAFEIVEVLVGSLGELVTKDDLMSRVWPGAIVEESTLHVHMSAIRKALGADRVMLKTVQGRGYRLLGSWTIRQASTVVQRDGPEPPHAAARPFVTNVPVAATALIGREAAVQELRDLLSAYRVVTLSGPGGIGKTVLAAEIARRLFPTLESDVFFVELVSLSEPSLVPSAVASLLGLQMGGAAISAEAVARALGPRKLLLVLDNCEHVVEETAKLAAAILRLCPNTSILTTSREVLHIDGEYVYHVPPLDVPSRDREDLGGALEHSAVQLFVARTRSLGADFSAQRENLPLVTAICRRLDGIPLAIEFAAARAATLGIQEVAGRLSDRFALLAGGWRTALPRHQTLRATLDWSYELLPEPERRLLRHLAIFPAGFTLDAAAAVMSDRSEVATGISNLVSKSLATMDVSASSRWRLLETIRAYALEKLAASGELEQAARRHAEFFRDLISTSTRGSQSQPNAEEMSRHLGEIDNVRAALDWSFSTLGDTAVGIELTAAYAPVWLHLSLVAECRERSEHALLNFRSDSSLNSPLQMKNSPLQMQLHIALGLALMATMGPVEQTKTVLTKAFEIAQSLDDVGAQVRALWALETVHYYCGDNRKARSAVDQLSQIAHRTHNTAIALVADRLMGDRLHSAGSHREARQYFERVLQSQVAPKHQRPVFWHDSDDRAMARAMLARVLWLQGFPEKAHNEANASLEELQATDHQLSHCRVFYYGMFPMSLMTDDLTAADRAISHLIDIATTLNAPFWRIVGRCLEGKLLIERREFGRGAVVLREALDTFNRTGWIVSYPEFKGALAVASAELGQLSEALDAVNEALAFANLGGELWYVPELLRLKGEFLIQSAQDQPELTAEGCFREAIAVARQQGALFWELRATLGLARLKMKQHQTQEARQALAPVYSRFTEGFGTPDLRSARAVLDSLAPS
jgi:predicted ATPase/DNA-binding winged helix-turn-helix (wHTH) protein